MNTKLIKKQPSVLSSRNGPICFGLSIIVLALGGFFAWAFLAPLAKGIVASGSVVVDSRRKAVQHFEGGIIKVIHVRDGSVVKAGDVLLELDNTLIRSEHVRVQTQLYQNIALIDRLRAEQNENELLVFSEELLSVKDADKVQAILRNQSNLFNTGLEKIQGEIGLLNQRTIQLNQSITGLRTQKKARVKEVGFIKKELKHTQVLIKKKLVELSRVLERQKELARVEGDINRIKSDIDAAFNEIDAINLEILQIKRNLQEKISNQILSAQEYVFELREKLIATGNVLKRTVITAPQNGVVIGLITNTVGGVVKPGVSILEIVPDSDQLVVEAQLRSTDVDNVYIDMPARMRFSAFKQRTTPSINGTVKHISADVLINPASQQPYYLVRIIIPKGELRKLQEVTVVPGMPVEVLITAGSRTPIEYLFDPIESVIRRGMKEE